MNLYERKNEVGKRRQEYYGVKGREKEGGRKKNGLVEMIEAGKEKR